MTAGSGANRSSMLARNRFSGVVAIRRRSPPMKPIISATLGWRGSGAATRSPVPMTAWRAM